MRFPQLRSSHCHVQLLATAARALPSRLLLGHLLLGNLLRDRRLLGHLLLGDLFLGGLLRGCLLGDLFLGGRLLGSLLRSLLFGHSYSSIKKDFAGLRLMHPNIGNSATCPRWVCFTVLVNHCKISSTKFANILSKNARRHSQVKRIAEFTTGFVRCRPATQRSWRRRDTRTST